MAGLEQEVYILGVDSDIATQPDQIEIDQSATHLALSGMEIPLLDRVPKMERVDLFVWIELHSLDAIGRNWRVMSLQDVDGMPRLLERVEQVEFSEAQPRTYKPLFIQDPDGDRELVVEQYTDDNN